MPDDFVVRHPPERGRSAQRSVVVYACCSCCCCLHTLGALVGAFVGGGLQRPDEDPGFDAERRIPGVHWLFDRLPRTQWIFWTSFAVMVLVTCLVLTTLFGASSGDLNAGFVLALFSIVLSGPLVAGLAWILSLVRLRCLPGESVAPDEWWALHRMLLWALVGSFVGIIVMAGGMMLLVAAARTR